MGAEVNMKSDKIKVKGGRHEKNTVLILAMMIMLACSCCFWDLITIDMDMGRCSWGYGNHDQGESGVHDGRR